MYESDKKNVTSYPADVTRNAPLYGFKTANLIHLQSVFQEDPHVKIPAFEAISQDDILRYLDANASGWHVLWQKFCVIQGDNRTISQDAQSKLEELQSLIKQTFRSKEFGTKIPSLQAAPHLMVRSTGNEDRVDVANPGGNESVVSKNSSEFLSTSIGEVIASYFSMKSLSQRLASGESITEALPLMACLVQSLVGEGISTSIEEKTGVRTPPISGVIYTNGREGVRIQSAPGHGELVVNSKGNFDNLYVSANNGVYGEVREKQYRLVPQLNEETGKIELVEKSNAFEQATTSSISEVVALRLADAARKIEKAYGMRMDIEFVYEPDTDTISIVQARAIPLGSRKGLSPCVLDPEYIEKTEGVERIKGSVITPDIMTAVKVKKPDEVIICDTIGQALNIYLGLGSDKIEKIKAVIIKDPAPDTSHEAGMFTSKAIPVIRFDHSNIFISQWQKSNTVDDKTILVIDPQNSSVFKTPTDAIFKEGIFKSGLTEHVSPGEAQERPKEKWENALSILKPLLNDLPTKSGLIYKEENGKIWQQVLKDIDSLSLPKQNIEEQENALGRLLGVAYRLRQNKKVSQAVFQKIATTGAELLKQLHALNNAESSEKDKLIQNYLDLHRKFTGLYESQGVKDVLSTSVIRQIAESKKYASYPVPPDITDETQKAYYKELATMANFIVIDYKKEEWLGFCKDVCTAGKGGDLANMVSNLQKLDLHQHWINTEFPSEKENEGNSEEILTRLDKKQSDHDTQQRRSELIGAIKTIDQMERKVEEFSDPKKFSLLFEKLQQDIELLDSIFLKPDNENLNLLLSAKQSMRMVDVIDRSIKALQISSVYNNDEKTLQVQNFRKIVSTFMGMLEKRVGKDYEDGLIALKDKMAKLMSDDPSQLDISKDFAVLSTNVRGGETEIEHGLESASTIADMHSAIHQNLIVHETQRMQPIVESLEDRLPEEVELFKQKMEQHFESSDKAFSKRRVADLFSVGFTSPLIILNYNIPLRSHSATMHAEYNTRSKKFTIEMNFSGIGIDGIKADNILFDQEASRWVDASCLFLAYVVRSDIPILQCEAGRVQSNFKVEVNKDYLDEILSVFNDIAIFTMEYGLNNNREKWLADQTSAGFSRVFQKSKFYGSLDSNARKYFLQESEKEGFIKEINDLKIGDEKKGFLKQSYNALALWKNNILTEDLINNSDLKRLETICSDGFLVASALSPQLQSNFLAIKDTEKLANMAVLNSTELCLGEVGFSRLSQLYDEDKDKFKALISDKAYAYYKIGVPFGALLEAYDNDNSENKGMFNALVSENAYNCYKTGVSLEALSKAYDDDKSENKDKFNALISEKALYLYNSLYRYSRDNKDGLNEGVPKYFTQLAELDIEKIKIMTSQAAISCYTDVGGKFLSFKQLIEFNTKKIMDLISPEVRNCYKYLPFTALIVEYDNDKSERKEKFHALTSRNAYLYYNEADSSSELSKLSKLYDEDNNKFNALISEDVSCNCFRYFPSKNETKFIQEFINFDIEKIKALTSRDAGSCYGDWDKKLPKFEQLKDFDAEKIKALTSQDARQCYRDKTGKLPNFEQLKDLSAAEIREQTSPSYTLSNITIALGVGNNRLNQQSL